MSTRRSFALTSMLLCGLAATASADNAESVELPRLPSLTFGPQFGINFAHTGGSGALQIGEVTDELLFSTQAHLKAGGHVTFARGRYALRLEAAYSTKGADVAGNVEQLMNVPYKLRYNMSYLSLPVLGILHIPYDGEMSPHFFAGPEVAFLLSSRVEGEATAADEDGVPITVEQEASLYDDTNSVALGAVIGAGMRYPSGRGAVTLDLRLALDVTQALGNSSIMTSAGAVVESNAMRHRVVTVGLGYEY